MFEWLKRLLGFSAAEQVLSLAERQQKASEKAQFAIRLFDGIVYDLRDAAGVLNSVADEAKTEAVRLQNVAADAVTEANRHLARAAKIAALAE